MKKLLLLLLPILSFGQNSWVNFEVRFDFYSAQESNFFMVGDANGDTVMFYQPTVSYEELDTTIQLNSGDYLVTLTDNYGDGWNSNQPAWFIINNLCQGDILNYSPLTQQFFTLDTLVNIWPCAPPVYGCMDTSALNYDVTATMDDGNCTYPPCNGFTQSNAYQLCWGNQAGIVFEWWSDANINCDVTTLHFGDENGYSYTYGGYWPANGYSNFAVGAGPGQMPPNWEVEHYLVLGYTDGGLSDTIFYTPSACIPGCTDSTQQSYNPWATIDDGSCSGTTCDINTQYQITMEVTLDNWPGETSWIMNSAGVIGEAVQGTYTFNDIGKTFTYNFCVDQNAGFELILNDSYGDGLAGTTSGGTMDGNVVIYDCNGDTIWMLPDPAFGNVTYSSPQMGLPCATTPDVYGCTSPEYQEYNPLANIDDGSCVNLHVYGCTDDTMFNYNPSATIMDLIPSCYYTLIIEDAASDGWGNSYVGISQGDSSWTYTMGPGSNTQSFNLTLDSDQLVEVYYFEVGGPQTPPEEVQFQTWHNAFYLINSLGDTLLAEGTNPFANNGQGALQPFKAPFWKNYYATPSCGNYCEEVVYGCLDSLAYNYNGLANTADTCYYQPGCTNPGYLEYYTQGFTADTDDGSCSTSIISGCTDSMAFNYDPLANLDNGGCLPVILGCMNPLAFNYNANANTNDTCIAVVYGCMSSIAINYDSLANTDDGSCIGVNYGCTDSTMWNYSPSANVDDNSCLPYVYGCTDATMWNYDASANTDNGSCVEYVYGCMDTTAFNYDPLANTDNGSCVGVIYGCTNPIALNYDASANTDDFSCILPIYGCMDSLAFNYNPLANVDNGSCLPIMLGCTDPIALNYCDSCNTDDFSCILPIYGCTDSTMFNYNPLANSDNNSCIPFISGCTDPSMLNYNPSANTEDFSCIAYIYGCMDSTALNFDPLANTSNNSCVEIVMGCMDPNAYNYESIANVNDSISCLYDAGCFTGPGNPYWLNDECYAWVISVDDYCCENEWDTICQATYDYCDGTWSGPLLTRVQEKKELIMITDLLGRPAKQSKNQLLFYLYNDGTVEKKLIKQ